MAFPEEKKSTSVDNKSSAEVTKAEDVKEVKPEKVSFDAKETQNSGSAIKTEKIASLVTPDGPFGGAKPMGISAAGEGLSGTGEGFLADQNRTPTASKTRADSRAGKKVEKIANQLNYTPSEQAIIGARESVRLSESPDSVQGFNGTPKTKSFKIQKKSGASPAELEYERSVDFIFKDMVYFADGQTIVKDGKVQDIYPSTKADRNTGAYEAGNFHLERENVLLDSVDVCCGNGGVKYIIFNETKLPCKPVDSPNLDASSIAYTVAINRAELEREDMDAKAGDEDKEGWSPIPRAIEEPGKVIAMLHDMEYITGTELFLAEKKSTQAMAFYLNKAVKDGQTIIKPAVEFLTGLVDFKQTGSAYNSSLSSVFTKANYRKGAASLIIPMYDSVAKYNNKADVVLQPRGPRMHFAGFRNGASGFRVNPLFVNAFNARETFGTIDHEYDPTKPLVMTDKAVAIHPISIAAFGDYGPTHIELEATENNMTLSSVGKDIILPGNKQFYLYYKNETKDDDVALTATTDTYGNAVINMNVGLVNGIETGDKVQIVISENSTAPEGYTAFTAQPELGETIRLGTLVKGKFTITRGYINQGPYVYSYNDRRNVYTREITLPLCSGLRAYFDTMTTKIHNLVTDGDESSLSAGEYVDHNINILATHSGSVLSLYDLILAEAADFMFKDRHQYMTDVDDYTRDHGYPFIQTMSVVDAVKTNPKGLICNGIDEPLRAMTLSGENAIMWQFPELFGKLLSYASKTYALCPWYVCEYEYKSANYVGARNSDEFGVCWPSIRNGNHLAAYDELYALGERKVRLMLDRITDVTYGLNQGDYPVVYKHGLTTDGQLVVVLASGKTITGLNILCMPRELGWSMLAPAGLLTPVSGLAKHNYGLSQVGNSCFRTYVYHNIEALADPVGNVAPTINNNRAADYVQDYRIIDCIGNNGTKDPFYGVSLGAGDCIDGTGAIEGRSTFECIVSINGTKVTSGAHKSLISDHTNLYYRLNVMPFIINPYDMITLYNSEEMAVDPFELSYALGLCGFRYSDCSEDVNNKLTACDNLGRLLVEDPFAKDSYLYN